MRVSQWLFANSRNLRSKLLVFPRPFLSFLPIADTPPGQPWHSSHGVWEGYLYLVLPFRLFPAVCRTLPLHCLCGSLSINLDNGGIVRSDRNENQPAAGTVLQPFPCVWGSLCHAHVWFPPHFQPRQPGSLSAAVSLKTIWPLPVLKCPTYIITAYGWVLSSCWTHIMCGHSMDWWKILLSTIAGVCKSYP